MAKKLAGHATGTAAWATNVGNEHGQVLMCVLTAAEGAGLTKMAAGLQRRYATAGQSPPTLMYVDWDCCSSGGDSAVARKICMWPDLAVRLDVWHFIRRFSSACTTDTHPLNSVFLSKLSACIFEWDAGDLTLLREAKQAQLSAKGMSYADVSQHITHQELEKHCRCRTRGTDKTTLLIQALIDVLDSPSGCDTTGMRLFDHIKDITRYQMYRPTGTVPAVLPDWYGEEGWAAAARLQMRPRLDVAGEFHRHLAHFVPGGGGGFQ